MSRIGVIGPGFEQQHGSMPVCSQSAGQHTSSGSPADDYHVTLHEALLRSRRRTLARRSLSSCLFASLATCAGAHAGLRYRNEWPLRDMVRFTRCRNQTDASPPRLSRRATVLSGDDELLPTWSSMAPCSLPSRPLRAGGAGGLRPVLTAAVRDAHHDIGRGGETVPGRTKKLPSGRGGGEVIAHPAIEHHQHLAHARYQRHLGWFATGRQSAIELAYHRVAAHRAQCCHIEHIAHSPPPAGNGAVAAPDAAVVVERRHPISAAA